MIHHEQSTSRSALDLLLDVDITAGRRVGVENALRDAIRSGRLRYGDALPSSRSLAEDLGVARATVVGAYEQLAAEGYVVARQGAATTVAFAPSVGGNVDLGAKTAADTATPADGSATGGSTAAGRPTADTTALVPELRFNPGRPDLSRFPRHEWKTALRTVMNTANDAEFDYPEPEGNWRLRCSLAGYLARTRATQSQPSDIIVTAGFLSGLAIIAEHLRRRGQVDGQPASRIVVEDPMLFLYRSLLEYLGVEVIPVPVDAEGLSVAQLAAVSEPVDAILVCPARQFPLGMTMSAGRRSELVEWARQYDVWIIEDDYDGEFRYDRRPVGALQGLAPDRVVHAGTASKTLAPGVRLGWLTVPEPLRQAMFFDVAARGPVSVIDQLTLAQMIDSGAYDRQIRTMRTHYRRRRDKMLAALSSLEGIRIDETAAGLSLCARFVDDFEAVDDRAVEQACMAAGVGVVALSRHYARRSSAETGVVIGFAAPAEHEFSSALGRLAQTLAATLVAGRAG